MKISKYEEHLLGLNKKGLENEQKILKKEHTWSFLKRATFYSASFLAVGAGGYVGINGMLDAREHRPAVAIYDNNEQRVNNLNKMLKSINEDYALNIDNETRQKISKFRDDITSKLEGAELKINEQNDTALAGTEEYIVQRNEKDAAERRVDLGAAFFTLGMLGLIGSNTYSKSQKRKLGEKEELVREYLN